MTTSVGVPTGYDQSLVSHDLRPRPAGAGGGGGYGGFW